MKMKSLRHIHLLGGVLLVAGCALLLSGCLGFGGGSGSSTEITTGQVGVATTLTSLADADGQAIVVSPADKYSSFQSKDPFIQQQVTTSTTAAATTSTSRARYTSANRWPDRPDRSSPQWPARRPKSSGP